MLHNLPFAQSAVSITGDAARYGSYSRLDQNPMSGHRNVPAESIEEVERTSARADQFDVSALVEQIWSFASHRIAQAEADGASEEELDSLWQAAAKGVEAGFGEARDILDDLGELDEPLAMKIDSAYGQLMDKIAARGVEPAQPDSDRSAAESPAVSARQSLVDRSISLYQYERQTFSLDLTTAQGDKIQIRAFNEAGASIDDDRFGNYSSTRWTSSQSTGYSLVVQGDLNEQETADLDALLAEVNELAAEFYEGDLNTAYEMASALDISGSSLMSLDLSMREVETKAAGVYAQTAGQPSSLPQGLVPLREYADKLIAAQENWQNRFNSNEDLLTTIVNHPRDNGMLARFAHELLF